MTDQKLSPTTAMPLVTWTPWLTLLIALAAAAAVRLGLGHGVGVERGVGRSLLDLDLPPVGVELVGHDHRHRGHRPLAHLRDGVGDRHDAVAIDLEPLVGREHARLLGARLAAQRQLESDHEAGPQGEAALEERPPGQRHRFHRPPPLFIAAALWMAARRRWYVPQRQMLPAIASSMSASGGFAFRASSAAADMICPDWQ